jgi:hypothetical protein
VGGCGGGRCGGGESSLLDCLLNRLMRSGVSESPCLVMMIE